MFGLGRRTQGGNDGSGDASGGGPTAAREPKTGGKGRPTPTRRQAEQRNYRPLVGGRALPANATKQERKAARKARREALNAERALQRQAMYTGDERHLPPRDRGEARRWVRDYVDARRGVGEYFLIFAVFALAMSLVRAPAVQLLATALLWGVMLTVVLESLLLRRTLKRETESRFGEKASGAATYGMLRSLQLRRTRLPRPQVARGQFPK